MSFASWAKMSQRDRMMAGLRGLAVPTRGVEYYDARGVRLGGLGLATDSMLLAQPAALQPAMTTAVLQPMAPPTTATFSPTYSTALAPAPTVATFSPAPAPVTASYAEPTPIAPTALPVPTYSSPPLRNLTTATSEPVPYIPATAPVRNITTAYAAPTPEATTQYTPTTSYTAPDPTPTDTAPKYSSGSDGGAPAVDADGNYVEDSGVVDSGDGSAQTTAAAAEGGDTSTKSVYFPVGTRKPKLTVDMARAAQAASASKSGIPTWAWIAGAAVLTYLAFKD